MGKIAEAEAARIGRSIGVCLSPSLDLVLCVCMYNMCVCVCVCMCNECVCVCVLFFLVRLIIGTLKKTLSDQRCFRMVGGVLMEQTVNEVLPALENNCTKVIDNCGTINITMCQCNTCLV